MKLYIYTFRNAVLESTGLPFFNDHDSESFSKQFQRSLVSRKADEIIQYENTTLYFLGTYDDETLAFELEADPVKLVDCNIVLEKRKMIYELLAKARKEKEAETEASEGEENGKSEE